MLHFVSQEPFGYGVSTFRRAAMETPMKEESRLKTLALNNYLGKVFDDLKLRFHHTPIKSIQSVEVSLEFTRKLGRKLGLTFLFDRKIYLNFNYFQRFPERLPYTLFHEMTHLWLYDSFYDPNHTARFYQKMHEFHGTKYPVDKEVKNPRFFAKEAEYIYQCPQCANRWHLHETLTYSMYCGPCYDRLGKILTLVHKNRELAINDTRYAIDAA